MMVASSATASSTEAGPAPALVVRDLAVSYGGVVALRPVSFEVAAGTVLAVLGPNGAGKTTLANALSGLVTTQSGSVQLGGRELAGLPVEQRVRGGLGHLPDSRAIFGSLSVAENLKMAFHREGSRKTRELTDAVFEVFPVLRERRRIQARRLSGGEQQMLGFARLLVLPPQLLIVDELSHGLAPGIVANLFKALGSLKGRCTMLVIEQFVTNCVSIADEVMVLSHGEIRHRGPASAFTMELAAELYSLNEGAQAQPGHNGDDHQKTAG
jgi:branched-chain amino acid transport system ATP-binding protein